MTSQKCDTHLSVFQYLFKCQREGLAELHNYTERYTRDNLKNNKKPLDGTFFLKVSYDRPTYGELDKVIRDFEQSFNPFYIERIRDMMFKNETIDMLYFKYEEHVLYAFPEGDALINEYLLNASFCEERGKK